jgi:hypothetical protein
MNLCLLVSGNLGLTILKKIYKSEIILCVLTDKK